MSPERQERVRLPRGVHRVADACRDPKVVERLAMLLGVPDTADQPEAPDE